MLTATNNQLHCILSKLMCQIINCTVFNRNLCVFQKDFNATIQCALYIKSKKKMKIIFLFQKSLSI